MTKRTWKQIWGNFARRTEWPSGTLTVAFFQALTRCTVRGKNSTHSQPEIGLFLVDYPCCCCCFGGCFEWKYDHTRERNCSECYWNSVSSRDFGRFDMMEIATGASSSLSFLTQQRFFFKDEAKKARNNPISKSQQSLHNAATNGLHSARILWALKMS